MKKMCTCIMIFKYLAANNISLRSMENVFYFLKPFLSTNICTHDDLNKFNRYIIIII